ncbi:MAG: phage tail tape measure protein [Faecalibacterium prausnitzii]|nr:phage tail tape measure protein [Faecalibacterium prausnitzii]
MAFDFSVTGNTKLDTSGFTQGVSSMTVAAGTLIADLVKTASSQLTNLAQSAIRNGSIYETSLAKVGTIADLGKLSIQKLGSQITDMSNTMGIAATDIAEATYQAISAGQDTANAVEFAGQAAKLATAGFTSTTSAVDILTTALNAYGLSADQATHVSDVLLTTQNLGKTSVDELSSSMGRVIPLAAAYNVSVENLSSGLAVMTANGIATAEATTYTKSMLNELGDTGSTVGKILQQQTGKSFAQLSADGKSLGDVLQVLYDSVGDDGTAFAGLWSSVEAGTGALSLVSGGADKFNGVLAQMVDSAGATDTAYQTMTDTFQHSMESLQTTAENLSIDLFEAMEPGLKEAANWGTDCLNTLTSALNEGGPAAMLDAASGILENLTAGVVQKIPGLASAATQVITKLVQYLADHQDEIFDAGIQLLEQLIIGITDNLPQLITAAAELIAKFSAALISHLPDLLNCGAALLTTLVDGILRSIENLGEAAIACIAKLTGVWDGSMDEWGHIGENIVNGLLNGITGMWDTLVSTVKGKVNGMVSTVKNVLGIHSPSKVFTEIGENVTQGLVNGINTGAPAAEQAIQNIAQTLSDYGPDFATVGATITEQFRTKLTEGWAQIQSDIQTDALGAIETLATALKDGDLESLGLWAASYFWQACTKEQQTQINSIALGALNQLGSALSGVFGNLSQLAMGLVAQFVPAAASATAGQTALNVAMDANPILLVISLIGMLVGALLNFSGKNKDVANAFQNVWAGVEDFMSYIFEGLMRIVAAGIEGFIILINGLIGAYNSVAWLYGGTIDYISNPAWDYANKIAADRKARQAERKKQQEAANNPSSSGTSTNSQKVIESMTDTSKTTNADGSTVTTKVLTEKLQDETGKITQRVTKTVTEAGTKLVDGVERSYKTVTTYVDGIQTKVERSLDDIKASSSATPTAPTPDKDLTDAVEANTEALLAANSKLAEMVRQANSLVLSDNMAISRSVAASGTAQVAAAANNYHREGDTHITQNIYSKAQTAADLQREARWEADRAKAQKR